MERRLERPSSHSDVLTLVLSKHRDICEQHAAVQAACLRSPHPAAFSYRIIYCNASVIHLLASHGIETYTC